jgi:glycine dehydrogenase subunit 1
MKEKVKRAHPYIPNSEPRVKQRMLEAIGAKDIEELYGDIPDRLRFRGRMNLPEPLEAEADLRRHVERLLARNRSCEDMVTSWAPAATTTTSRPSATRSPAVRNS